MKRFVASVMLLTLSSLPTTALADGEVPTPAATAPAAPTPAPRAPAIAPTAAHPAVAAAPPAPAAAAPAAPAAAALAPAAAPAAAALAPAAAALAPAAETADAPAGTPLATRPAKALTLAPTNEGTPFGYKFLAFIGVAGAAGLWLRKRYGAKTSPRVRTRIDVLGRTSVGVRSDLLVVDVEGTRLLLGMTPSAIQTLAVLEMPEALTEQPIDAAEAAEARRAELAAAMEEEPDGLMPAIARSLRPTPLIGAAAPIIELGDRVRSLLAPRRGIAAREELASVAPSGPAPARGRRTAAPKRARVAGQAKGLLLALEPPPKASETKDEPEREPIRLGDW